MAIALRQDDGVVDASLLTGPLPWTLVGAGVLGGALLLGRRARAWWSWAVPSVLAAVASWSRC